MSSRDHDDLKELFGAFMGPEEARKAADEVRAADEMLRANPAPEASREVLLKIKARGAAELAQRRRVRAWRKYAGEAIAAAAMLIILGGVGLKIFQNGPSSIRVEYLSKAVWETNSIVSEDVTLAYISTEIEQLEQQFKTLVSPGEQTDTSTSELYDMEMELIAMETDFWKG